MESFSATQLKNKTGDVLAKASQLPVAIERHGKPRFVILSVERYGQIVAHGAPRRADYKVEMPKDEADELIAALQAGKS